MEAHDSCDRSMKRLPARVTFVHFPQESEGYPPRVRRVLELLCCAQKRWKVQRGTELGKSLGNHARFFAYLALLPLGARRAVSRSAREPNAAFERHRADRGNAAGARRSRRRRGGATIAATPRGAATRIIPTGDRTKVSTRRFSRAAGLHGRGHACARRLRPVTRRAAPHSTLRGRRATVRAEESRVRRPSGDLARWT